MKALFQTCVLFSFLFIFQETLWAQNCGSLSESQGRVEVHRLVKGKTAADGTPVRYSYTVTAPYSLLCTDVVVTGPNSAAKVKLPNSVLSLGSQSRIQLSAPVSQTNRTTLLQLSFGKIRSFFQKPANLKDKMSTFKIRTPATVTGVRGTDFYVSYDPNTSLSASAVLKGDIEVTNSTSGETVVVKSGEQVQVFAPEEALKKDTAKTTQKLNVEPISTQIKDDIRATSVLAKTEVDFHTPEAVKILGAPEAWKPIDPSQVPGDLKDIENKF
jgi:hypothetical protein